MERLLECSVCLEQYDPEERKPLVLPCGHTACLRCVRVTMERERLCPVCRKPTGADVSALQVNYALICDSRPTAGGEQGPSQQQRDDVKRTINQLLTSLEDEKSSLSYLQSRWKALRHEQNLHRLSLINAFSAAIDSLQQAIHRTNSDFQALDESCQREIAEEEANVNRDIQAKMECVGELTKVLAGNSLFDAEKVAWAETQLARPYVAKIVTARVAAISTDLPAKTSAAITELTSAGLTYATVAVNPKMDCQASFSHSSIPVVSTARVEPKRGKRRKDMEDGSEQSAEKPDRPRREKPERKEPQKPQFLGEIPQPGGPSAGAVWSWVKNDNSVKYFRLEESQALENAFQSGQKQYNLMNAKNGAVAFAVDFATFTGLKGGKGKARPMQRRVEEQ